MCMHSTFKHFVFLSLCISPVRTTFQALFKSSLVNETLVAMIEITVKHGVGPIKLSWLIVAESAHCSWTPVRCGGYNLIGPTCKCLSSGLEV
jgi:hypothetical protein